MASASAACCCCCAALCAASVLVTECEEVTNVFGSEEAALPRVLQHLVGEEGLVDLLLL
jgi:hypothetical protein